MAGLAVAALVTVTLSTAEVVADDARKGLPLPSLIVVTLGVVRAEFVIAVPLVSVVGRSPAAIARNAGSAEPPPENRACVVVASGPIAAGAVVPLPA